MSTIHPVTERARDALNKATPGPWVASKSGYIGSTSGVMIHNGQVLGDTAADTELIALSPTLAAAVNRAAKLADDLDREAADLRRNAPVVADGIADIKSRAAARIRAALEGAN